MEFTPKNMEPNTFYIDSREWSRSNEIKDFLESHMKNDKIKYDSQSRPFKIHDKNVNLIAGDYAFMNDKNQTIGFEYKTIGDFDMSINNSMDNLFRKCEDLCRVYDCPNLIIKGDKLNSHLDEKKYEMTLNALGHSLNIREPRTQELSFYHILKSIMNYDDGRGIPRNYSNRFYNEALNVAHVITGASHIQCRKIVDACNMSTWQDVIRFLNMTPLQFQQLKKESGKKLNYFTVDQFIQMQNNANHKKPWDNT